MIIAEIKIMYNAVWETNAIWRIYGADYQVSGVT